MVNKKSQLKHYRKHNRRNSRRHSRRHYRRNYRSKEKIKRGGGFLSIPQKFHDILFHKTDKSWKHTTREFDLKDDLHTHVEEIKQIGIRKSQSPSSPTSKYIRPILSILEIITNEANYINTLNSEYSNFGELRNIRVDNSHINHLIQSFFQKLGLILMLHEKNPPGLIYDVFKNLFLEHKDELVRCLNDDDDENIRRILIELLTKVTEIFKDERFLSHAYIYRGYRIDYQEIQDLQQHASIKPVLAHIKEKTGHQFFGLLSPTQMFSRYQLLLKTIKKSFEGTGIDVSMLDDAIDHMNNAIMIQSSERTEELQEPLDEDGDGDEVASTSTPSDHEVASTSTPSDHEVVDVGTLAMGLTLTEVDEVLSSIGIQELTLTPEIKVKLKELILSQRQKKIHKEEDKVEEQLEGLEKPVLEKQVASALEVVKKLTPVESPTQTGSELWKKTATLIHAANAFGTSEDHSAKIDEAKQKLESLQKLNRKLVDDRGVTQEGSPQTQSSPVGSSPSSPSESGQLSPAPSSPGALSPEEKIERLQLNRYFEGEKTKYEQISDTVELHAELSEIPGLGDESSIEKLRKKLIEELKKKLGIKSEALHLRDAPPSSGATPIEEIHALPDERDKYLNMLIKQQQKIKKFLESVNSSFNPRDMVFVIDPNSEDYRHPAFVINLLEEGRVLLEHSPPTGEHFQLDLQSVIPYLKKREWLLLNYEEVWLLKHILEGTWVEFDEEMSPKTSFEIKLNCGGEALTHSCTPDFIISSNDESDLTQADFKYFSDGYLQITASNNEGMFPRDSKGVFNHLGLYWTYPVSGESGEIKVSHWIKTAGSPAISALKEFLKKMSLSELTALFDSYGFDSQLAVFMSEKEDDKRKYLTDMLIEDKEVLHDFEKNGRLDVSRSGGNNKRSKRLKRSKRSKRTKRLKRTKRSRKKRSRVKRSRVKRSRVKRRRNTHRR